MEYINKRKTIGLIANEWFGIEICKVDDIISFIENLPAESVERVIRCGECKHEGHFYECPFDMDIKCKKDDYCSRGHLKSDK